MFSYYSIHKSILINILHPYTHGYLFDVLVEITIAVWMTPWGEVGIQEKDKGWGRTAVYILGRISPMPPQLITYPITQRIKGPSKSAFLSKPVTLLRTWFKVWLFAFQVSIISVQQEGEP